MDVTKTGSAASKAGDPASYTVTITNTGSGYSSEPTIVISHAGNGDANLQALLARDTGWQAVTRAFTFNEQVTTKDGEFAEFEFDRSNAVIDKVMYEQHDHLYVIDSLEQCKAELERYFDPIVSRGPGGAITETSA